jgi:hypothetical protein
MKYAVQVGSGAKIYVPSFINKGPGIPREYTNKDRNEIA